MIRDCRYGPVKIVALSEKHVWYKTPTRGVRRISRQAAHRRMEYGPEWNDGPRWELV